MIYQMKAYKTLNKTVFVLIRYLKRGLKYAYFCMPMQKKILILFENFKN